MLDREKEDYARYKDSLTQHNTDKNFEYGKYNDEIDYREKQDQKVYDRNQDTMQNEYNVAVIAQEMGDDEPMREWLAKYGGVSVPAAVVDEPQDVSPAPIGVQDDENDNENDNENDGKKFDPESIPNSVVRRFRNAATNEDKIILVRQWIKNKTIDEEQGEYLLRTGNVPAELWS